jgi:hypothetical protein
MQFKSSVLIFTAVGTHSTGAKSQLKVEHHQSLPGELKAMAFVGPI